MAKVVKAYTDSAGLSSADIDILKKKLDVMKIELEIYREIGGLAVKGEPRSAILRNAIDYALKALDADSGAIYMPDNSSGKLTAEVVKSTHARTLRGPMEGVAKKVARTGKPYLSRTRKADNAIKSTLAAPLVRKGRIEGVIEVVNKRHSRSFTPADLDVLVSIANHVAIIAERASLFAELDGKVRQFTILNEVGNLLVSTLDQAVVRRRAMEAVTRLMRAETGSLLLVDQRTNELYFEVALGEKGKRLKEIRLSIGEGIAGWVAERGEPVIIHDVARDRRFLKTVDKKSKFKTRNMICVPVMIRGVVIGVLQAINRLEGTFTEEDLKLFQLFSNQVAIALDNARLYEEVRDTFYDTSGALAEAIEKRDPYTGGHTKRVLEYSLAIARRLKLSEEMMEVVKLSAVLHDIGKIGIEDNVLKKDGPLSSDEAALMRRHPELGVEILKMVPKLKEIVPGMLYHHEKYDGTGYPYGFKGEDIPLVARIISVADAFDAMTSTRPYRKSRPTTLAAEEIRRCSGTQFDIRIVNAFMEAFEDGEIDEIRRLAETDVAIPQLSAEKII